MKVLGIETSCDDTGVAIYDSEQGLLAHKLHTQLDLHAQYGGVVPELSSRDHVRKVVPLVQQTLAQVALSLDDIDGIAYTAGPGLIGALLVGATFARSLAWARQLPSVAVHHLEAHVLAVMMEEPAPSFPFLALLVSGGHTSLIFVEDVGRYQLLGETLDDAAGEAFDKTAKLMGLAYPGGAKIGQLAEQGDKERYRFPRPMVDRPGVDFSFSGLKTYALNTWQRCDKTQQDRCDIAWAFQEAVVDTLTIKARRALDLTSAQRIVLAGGVACNQRLRQHMGHMAKKHEVELFYPQPQFCTDNGAMVAYAGCCRLLRGQHDPLNVPIRARWPLSELTS